LLKCDERQDFLFGRPVPCKAFEARFLACHPSGDECDEDTDPTTAYQLIDPNRPLSGRITGEQFQVVALGVLLNVHHADG
jgi:hypothetical protein